MGLNEILAHVVGVRGHITHAANAGNRSGGADQTGKPDRSALAVEPMIGVDVLTEQGDLAHARIGKARDLVENVGERPRGLGAARVRHDAE